MKLRLGENIRALRKDRALTQEQLAEVLGVTAGAVYKWESGMSVPELPLIVELADFFDTSVDALLGYQMKDNRPEATVERLNSLCRSLDPAALWEAEKALKKYPQSFDLVYTCAGVYLSFAAGDHDRKKAARALELLEKSLVLLPRNSGEGPGELTIYGSMADAYAILGDWEKSVALLKRHNAGGIFDHSIGVYLAVYQNRPEEAEPFLSDALLRCTVSLLETVAGYVFLFSARRDYASARDIVLWSRDLFLGLKRTEAPDFLDKTYALLRVLLAHTLVMTGEAEKARQELEEAAALSRRFDAAPDYGVDTIRFAAAQGLTVHDGLGPTAAASVKALLGLLKNEALCALWKECAGDG